MNVSKLLVKLVFIRLPRFLTHANSIDELKLRLKLFCEDFLNEGLANMHTTKMICREIENENPLIDDIFQETFLKSIQRLLMFLKMLKRKVSLEVILIQ